VGSVEHARIHGVTNLNTFRDGFRVLRTIFSEYGRMHSRRRATRRTGAAAPVAAAPAATPAATRLDRFNRNTPAASAHPADPRSSAAHVNRGAYHEIGTRRTDDIKQRLQARTALED
jgi:hypothetical protein